MENHQIEEDNLANIGQPGEEDPPMKTPRESLEIKGPWPNDRGSAKGQHYYVLYEDNVPVAEVFGHTQQEALERALLMAAAPRMADVLEGIMDEQPAGIYDSERLLIPIGIMADAYQESQGLPCEQCETLGQPSRMTFSPTNRLYHPTCIPEDVKAAIAAEGRAAECDDDLAF